MLTILDNYDSFVHTLAGYGRALGVACRVVRNDAVTVADVADSQAILISPGPGRPEDAGVCGDVVRALVDVPMLGVCLGHQVIGDVFGARVVRGEPVHGRTSVVTHDQAGVFEGITSPLRVARYHSLRVTDVQDPLRVTATTADGVVMAVAHRARPLWGVQFHPESVQSDAGWRLLANFLNLAGLSVDWSFVEQRTMVRVLKTDPEADFFTQPIQPAYPLPGPSSPSDS